jgi:hypothetical protein
MKDDHGGFRPLGEGRDQAAKQPIGFVHPEFDSVETELTLQDECIESIDVLDESGKMPR